MNIVRFIQCCEADCKIYAFLTLSLNYEYIPIYSHSHSHPHSIYSHIWDNNAISDGRSTVVI